MWIVDEMFVVVGWDGTRHGGLPAACQRRISLQGQGASRRVSLVGGRQTGCPDHNAEGILGCQGCLLCKFETAWIAV